MSARVKGHRLEVTSTRPGRHLVGCSCGVTHVPTGERRQGATWMSWEAPKYKAQHQAHLAEIKR